MAKVHQNSTIAEIFYMPLKMLKGSKRMRNSFCHRRTVMARMHQKSKLNLEEKPYWINIR